MILGEPLNCLGKRLADIIAAKKVTLSSKLSDSIGVCWKEYRNDLDSFARKRLGVQVPSRQPNSIQGLTSGNVGSLISFPLFSVRGFESRLLYQLRRSYNGNTVGRQSIDASSTSRTTLQFSEVEIKSKRKEDNE